MDRYADQGAAMAAVVEGMLRLFLGALIGAFVVQYFAELEAPFKRLVWFEQSAHNPPFEQPNEFNRILIEEVRPWAVTLQERSKQRAPGHVEEVQ